MAYSNQNTSNHSKQANQQGDRQEVPPLKQDGAEKHAANNKDVPAKEAPEKEAPPVTPAPEKQQASQKAR